jgi:hypothetical protein
MKIPLLVLTVLLAGCSVKTAYVPLECRHTAVACALAVQEEHPDHEVKIAFGTAKNKTDLHHAQAKFRLDDDPWKYISLIGDKCVIGGKEEFIELQDADVMWYIRYRILLKKPINTF